MNAGWNCSVCGKTHTTHAERCEGPRYYMYKPLPYFLPETPAFDAMAYVDPPEVEIFFVAGSSAMVGHYG